MILLVWKFPFFQLVHFYLKKWQESPLSSSCVFVFVYACVCVCIANGQRGKLERRVDRGVTQVRACSFSSSYCTSADGKGRAFSREQVTVHSKRVAHMYHPFCISLWLCPAFHSSGFPFKLQLQSTPGSVYTKFLASIFPPLGIRLCCVTLKYFHFSSSSCDSWRMHVSLDVPVLYPPQMLL